MGPPHYGLWDGGLDREEVQLAFSTISISISIIYFRRKDPSWRNNPLLAHPGHRKWMPPRCSISADVKCREAQTPGRPGGLSPQQRPEPGRMGWGPQALGRRHMTAGPRDTPGCRPAHSKRLCCLTHLPGPSLLTLLSAFISF